MKRLVWLLLAVFCTALAQVQSVEPPVSKNVSCSCCKMPGACALPDCGQRPAPATAGFIAEQPARTVQLAARRNASRSRRVAVDFLAHHATGASLAAVTFPTRVPAVVSVPLFEAYRSLLI